MRVEEGPERHRVEVDGLDEVREEGALDPENVPPGQLVWKSKTKTLEELGLRPNLKLLHSYQRLGGM